MSDITTGNKKYLFYMDILGFKNMVKKRNPDQIYKVVDDCLNMLYMLERLNKIYSTIYFSDTILFYQTCEEYADSAFADIYAMAGHIFCSMLANGIPIRGVITYGDFVVKIDSEKRNNIFFGDALIESYEIEKDENLIGILLTKEAFKYIDKSVIKALTSEKVFYELSNGLVYLNPFMLIRGYWYYEDYLNEGGDLIIQELKAFKFIHDKYKEIKASNSDKRVVEKYKNTIDILKKCMGEEMYIWALGASEKI